MPRPLVEAPGVGSAASRYFTELSAAFEEAAYAAGGVVEHDLAIGPRSVRLRFAGEGLLPVTLPSLAHHITNAIVEPSATVCVWDTRTTAVDPPPYPFRPRHVREHGEIEGYNDERFRTAYHGDPVSEDLGFDALSMYDAEAGNAVFWVRGPERIPAWARVAPLLKLLHWVLSGPRRCLAHSAVVGDERGALLLAGPGGSGKSTTALACLDAGMGFASDDYILLSLDGAPVAYSLYCRGRLTIDSLELLPGLRGEVAKSDVPEEEKVIMDVFRHRPGQIVTGVPLKALLVPQVIGRGPTRVVPMTALEALLALAPTSIYQLGQDGGVLEALADLARDLPVYRLELGDHVTDGPRAIRNLLARETLT